MKGINYIKASILKFKKDALSKIFYDILKVLIIALLAVLTSNFIPEGFELKDALNSKVDITWFEIFLYLILVVIIIVFAISILFKKKYSELKQLHLTDELTGLNNHKALKDFLDDKFQNLSNKKENMSYILIDIDNFKQLNTDYGYNVADEILRKLGGLLANDRRVTDKIFRKFNRGDEFVVIANETSLHGAMLAAERKRKLIEKTTFTVENQNFNITVCCGVTEFKNNDSPKTIADRANKGLIEAKKSKNKNCIKSNI